MSDQLAKEQSFVEMMTRSPEHARKGFEILLKRPDLDRFFDPLEKARLFEPAQNPSVVPAEDPGYFRVPYWDALDYLTALARCADAKSDATLASKVMKVVRTVSNAREPDGSVRDNYHTSRKFAEIIGLVPSGAISLADIEMVREWLSSKFDRGLVTHALDQGPMRRFIASDKPEDWSKACAIFRHCTAIRWAEEPGTEGNRKKAHALADEYWLREMMKNHLKDLARRLPEEVVGICLDRMREVFTEGSRNEMSWLWRPAIEDHDQNHSFREVENVLVEGLRDALLVWTEDKPDASTQLIAHLITDEVQIVRRVAIHVVSEHWQHLRGIYTANLGPSLFVSGHLHELYRLLKNNFAVFTDEEKTATFQAIRELPIPSGEEQELRLRRTQMRWVSSLLGSGYGPAESWYKELTVDPEVGRTHDHIDFHSYMQTRWGPGPSPYPIEELVGFAENGTLIEKLHGFQPGGFFESPTREALVQSLEEAVVQHPKTFINILPIFVNAQPRFQWAVVNGFKRKWADTSPQKEAFDWSTAWGKLIAFFETLFSSEAWWKPSPPEADSDTPVETDVPVTIADLLQEGTRNDQRAFAPELLPRTWKLITVLLARMPKAKEPGEDPVTRSINTPKGRSIEALFSQALRTCRLEHNAIGGHDSAWEKMHGIFEQELQQCRNDNYEFSTLSGQYFAHLDWMSHEWLLRHITSIFPVAFPVNLTCAVEGLAYAPSTRPTYALLVQNGILDSALQLNLRSDGREKLIQRIVLAYLWGDEDLESPRLKILFNTDRSEDLESGVDLLWSANPDELEAVQIERILLYWDRCIAWSQRREEPPTELFSSLSHFARFVQTIGPRELTLLLAVAPYVHVGHRSHEFTKELSRWVDKNADEVVIILRKLIEARKPDYDYEDKLKSLLLKLAAHGKVEEVRVFAEQLRKHIPGMLQLYASLGAPPKLDAN